MVSETLLVLASVLATTPATSTYVGDEPCSICHESQYESFRATAMGRTISPAGENDPLATFSGKKEFYSPQADRYYSVEKRDDRYFHRETQKDAQGNVIYSAEEAVTHAVGSGVKGWGYLFERGNRLYMSPLGYYTRTQRWDLSPGYSRGPFSSFSRPVTLECLVCHSGVPNPVPGTVNVYQDPPFTALSISCERCHGPGSEHVERVSEGETDPSQLAIVNPARLEGNRRDNVCDQCHLRGDARVLRPGKTFQDFQAGELLSGTVAVFSVPLEFQGEAFFGISHAERLRASRCWEASQGKLGCITCHNPHEEPPPDQKAEYYRKGCLNCHNLSSCAAETDSRQATNPPDDCISCHMPPNDLAGVPHSIGTEHRISRFPAAGPSRLDELNDQAGAELKNLTGSRLTTRTRALAYAQVAPYYAQFRQEGYQLLLKAIREHPEDLHLNETLGLIQLRVSSSMQSAGAAGGWLQKAVDLGSSSGLVHHMLARVRLRQGRVEDAIQTLQQGIGFEPHYSPSSTLLAEISARMGNPGRAIQVLKDALVYNPGDGDLRQLLEQLSTREQKN